MDEIQKVLVKAGRKDLAQNYYNKVAGSSTKEFKNEKEFKTTIKSFLNSVKSNLVYIDEHGQGRSDFDDDDKAQYWGFSFEIKFNLKDKYIDETNYKSGNAYIYPSKSLKTDCEKAVKKFFDADKVIWNNMGIIGSISGIVRK